MESDQTTRTFQCESLMMGWSSMLLVILLQSLLLELSLILHNIFLFPKIGASIHYDRSEEHGMPKWRNAV